MTNPPDERGAELQELFFETSQELLQALNDEALKLEKTPGDEEIVRVIRRTVHTLKGDSAACGLRELSELAHQFEDALSLEGTATQAAVAAWPKFRCGSCALRTSIQRLACNKSSPNKSIVTDTA